MSTVAKGGGGLKLHHWVLFGAIAAVLWNLVRHPLGCLGLLIIALVVGIAAFILTMPWSALVGILLILFVYIRR